MKRHSYVFLAVVSALFVQFPGRLAAQNLVFKQLFERVANTPDFEDPIELCEQKNAASQAAAKQIVAMGGAAVPALMAELGPHYSLSQAQDLLFAIGEPCHDALRRVLPTARGTIVHNTIGRMGYEAQPLIPDLLKKLQFDGRDPQYDVSCVGTLVQIGADRQQMALKLKEILENAQAETGLATLVNTLHKLGPDAAPAVPAVKKWLQEHPDPQYFDVAVRELRSLGPAAAPLVPEIINYYKSHSPRSGYSENAALVLGRIGPGAKESLPLLKAWLQKTSSQSHAQQEALVIATAIDCVEGAPARAVPKLKQAAAAAFSKPNNKRGISLYLLMDAVGTVWLNDPRQARELLPLLNRVLEERMRGSTARAAMAAADLGPLALGAVPALIKSTSGVYERARPSYSSSYHRSVEALRTLAPYDDRALATLEELATSDPHIRIRNRAREAVVYAKAVGPLEAPVAASRPSQSGGADSPATKGTTPNAAPADELPRYKVLSYKRSESALRAKVLVEAAPDKIPTDQQLAGISQQLSEKTELRLSLSFYVWKMNYDGPAWATAITNEGGQAIIRRFDDRMPENYKSAAEPAQ